MCEIKFEEKNGLYRCANHLLHVMHSQMNLQWFLDYFVFVVNVYVRCQFHQHWRRPELLGDDLCRIQDLRRFFFCA